MDYKEKYEQTLERAREIIKDYENRGLKDILFYAKEDFEAIFPELAESEDEKIIKELITHCRNTRCVTEEGAERIAKWITWLEKQGEIDKESYEINEKEKREFVGDGFIKCYADFQDFKEGETYWLEYLGNDNYNVRSDNLFGKTYHITPCQLYTVFKKQTWLEKQGEPIDDNIITRDDEILQAISIGLTDALENFGWSDFGGLPIEEIQEWLEKQGEQKTQVHFPKFTFDDVLALQCCMETVKKVQEDKELYEQLNLIHSKACDAYWLEKQEGCEHIKKEWTTSDAATLKELIDFLENGTAKLQHDLTRYANWLKIQFTPIEKKSEQKSTWSEEDEEMFKSIMATCELAEQERDSSPARHLLEMQLNWLKSLKNRIKNGGY